MELQVRTRENTNAEGKSRVYFFCHPEDFDAYFDFVCEDVFQSQDCAVYYKGTGEYDQSELAVLLSEMQLFIVPITSNFLYKESSAWQYEYSFALEHRIPLVPILVERDLQKCFAERMNMISEGFGDLQFLDSTSFDLTEIPYEEKLKKRLSSVLVEGELLKRVRAAFDAYIFLSYRKKDREKAKGLMSLIHSIPFCRDIAIWYDEYLVPGEKWSDAIAEAMAKSILVVLGITPHLVEPDNYIQTTEYPETQKRGKMLIPVELLPTDIESLRSIFPGLPAMIDGNNVKEIEIALKPVIEKYASQHQNSAEHEFLMGLAYLNGIDFERNVDRGVELITKASDQGLLEAIVKLMDMYKYGDGVKQDVTKYVMLNERVVSIFLKHFHETKDRNSAFSIVQLYTSSISEIYSLTGDCSYINEWCEKALIFADSIVDEVDFRIKCDFKGIVYSQLGKMAEDNLDLSKAKQYYKYILEMEYPELEGTQFRTNIGEVYISLGNIEIKEKNFNEAKKFYNQSIESSKKACEMWCNNAPLYSMRKAFKGLASIEEYQGNFEGAEVLYQKCLELGQLITERDVSKNIMCNIFAEDCLSLGHIYYNKGQLDTAQEWIEKGIRHFEKVLEKSVRFEIEWNLSLLYEELGNLKKHCKEWNEAKEWYRKSEGCYERFWRKGLYARRTFEQMLSTYLNLSIVNFAADNLAETEKYQQKSFIALQQWKEKNGLDQWNGELIILQSRIFLQSARVYEKKQNFAEADIWYSKASSILASGKEKLSSKEFGFMSCLIYRMRGNAATRNKAWDNAARWLKKARKIAEVYELSNAAIDSKLEYAMCYVNLAQMYEQQNQLELARKELCDCFDFYIHIRDQIKNPNEEAVFARVTLDLMSIAIKQNKIKEIETWWEQFYILFPNLGKFYKMDRTEFVKKLQSASLYLGQQLCKSQNFDRGIQYYETCFELQNQYKIAINESLEMDVRGAMASVYDKLGDYAKLNGDIHEAKEYYEKGIFQCKIYLDWREQENIRMLMGLQYQKIGELASLDNCHRESIAAFRKSVEIFEPLLENRLETIVKTSRQMLFGLYGLIGKAECQNGNFLESEIAYKNSLDLLDIVVKENTSMNKSQLLATLYGGLMEAALKAHKFKKYFGYAKELAIRSSEIKK